MPIRSNIAPEDDLSFDAQGCATNDEDMPFSATPFSTNNVPCDSNASRDNNNLNLIEVNGRISQQPFHQSSREWSHYFNLKLLLWVILGHGLLLFLLVFLWRTQSEQLGFSFTESSTNAPTATKALKAYFIYAPKTQTSGEHSFQDKSVKEPVTASELITVPPNPASPTAGIEQAAKVPSKPTVKPTPKPDELRVKPPEVSAQASKKSVSNSSAQRQIAQSTKESVNTLTKTEVQISPAQATSTHQSAADEQSGGAAGSVGLFTQRYFERQREQALDDLVLEQANHYTKRSTMSEMSPEMEVLIVPNADDFSGPTSLDLELDPNRIVRKGDTCYRVVKVGTQINPYAENLGFPFDCSGKKMNQEIDDAIKAQLDKMMVKRPKG